MSGGSSPLVRRYGDTRETLSALTVLTNLTVSGDLRAPMLAETAVNRETLSGNKTLSSDSASVQSLDPAGDRTVTFPANGSRAWYFVVNRGGIGEDITVNDAGSTTIATLAPDDGALFFDDGSQWIFIQTSGGVV